MRYSKLFGKTLREKPHGAEAVSHQLLLRAGFLRPANSGVFDFLPLGFRVLEKINRLVSEEFTKRGGQHFALPLTLPPSTLKEPEQNSGMKQKLAACRAQHRCEYFLAQHHEETLTALAGTLKMSYRDLPVIVGQAQWRHRDEFRSSVGLLCARQFLMQSAYSFDLDERGLEQSLGLMTDAYHAIFDRMTLDVVVLKTNSRNTKKSLSEEFMVMSDAGEETKFVCDTCEYKANLESAESVFPEFAQDDEPKPIEAVLGEGIIGVAELARFLRIPVHQTTKTLLFQADDRVVAVCIRGEYDISELKLANLLLCRNLKLAPARIVKELTGADVGYAGPIGLPRDVEVIWDRTTRARVNFEAGANRTDYHYINVNFDRDVTRPAEFVDVRKVKQGETCTHCKRGKLLERRVIKLAHVSKLGTIYSKELGATFIDPCGKIKPMVMGCCGMDKTRLLATVVEQHNDDRGIVWPEAIAPFAAHLVSLPGAETRAQEIYHRLVKAGVEVLWDDREESAGVKFIDADLIGIPVRLVVSKRTADRVERRKRNQKTTELVSVEELIQQLASPHVQREISHLNS